MVMERPYTIVQDDDRLRTSIYYRGQRDALQAVDHATYAETSSVYPTQRDGYDYCLHVMTQDDEAIDQLQNQAERYLDSDSSNEEGAPSEEPEADVVSFLNMIELFEHASAGDLKTVARYTHWDTYRAGQQVIQRGGTSRDLLMIQSGELDVLLPGTKKTLETIGPGDYIGEMGLVDASPRSTSVWSRKPCRVLVLSERGFRTLLTENTSVAVNVLLVLSRKLSTNLRSMNKKVQKLVQSEPSGS